MYVCFFAVFFLLDILFVLYFERWVCIVLKRRRKITTLGEQFLHPIQITSRSYLQFCAQYFVCICFVILPLFPLAIVFSHFSELWLWNTPLLSSTFAICLSNSAGVCFVLYNAYNKCSCVQQVASESHCICIAETSNDKGLQESFKLDIPQSNMNAKFVET